MGIIQYYKLLHLAVKKYPGYPSLPGWQLLLPFPEHNYDTCLAPHFPQSCRVVELRVGKRPDTITAFFRFRRV